MSEEFDRAKLCIDNISTMATWALPYGMTDEIRKGIYYCIGKELSITMYVKFLIILDPSVRMLQGIEYAASLIPDNWTRGEKGEAAKQAMLKTLKNMHNGISVLI
jgi:hypothetical protein